MTPPRRNPVAVLVTVLLVAGCAGEPAGPPSILLISLDTTRADRLGCYGHEAATTPVIDALAREGVRFDRAFSPVPVTLPAHATLLTGLWPHRHGIRDNGLHRLPDEIPTLAERLRDAGYDTAAVVAAAVLDRQYGLDRGFTVYDDRTDGGGGLAIPERNASAVTDAALAAAGALGSRYFLFVHYFDPHADYRPPAPFAEAHAGRPYDGEVAYVDREIGRLLDGLAAAGRLRGTLVVVTADHGESLGEHGEATHGVFLYQSTLRVPLLFSGEAVDGDGRVVVTPVSLADVTPTLLEVAGIESAASFDGRSLASFLHAGASPALADPLFPLESEHGLNSYGWAPLRGATDGRFKWIDAPRPELYDLVDDPDEARSLLPGGEAERDRLRSAWRATVVEDRRAPPPGGASDLETAERLDRLASLGYVLAPGQAGAAAGERPDPKSVIDTLDRVNDARAALAEGRTAAAESTLTATLDRSPRNVSALVLLASARILDGRHAEALAPLEQAARLAPHEADVWFNLGLAHFGAGDQESAVADWSRTVELAPRHLEATANLIDLLIRRDRGAEAQARLDAARAAGLDGAMFDYFEGRLAFDRGTWRSATVALQRAVRRGLPPALDGEARTMLQRIAERR